MAILNLIGGAKGLAILLVILALGGYIFKIKHDASEAEQQVVTVTAQRDAAGVARDAAIAANATNLATIGQLNKEKQDIQNSLNRLESDRKVDQAVTAQLRKSIASQANNPENKKTIAPVISSTIKDIQAARDKRTASWQGAH